MAMENPAVMATQLVVPAPPPWAKAGAAKDSIAIARKK
jgi:hypothetical protein